MCAKKNYRVGVIGFAHMHVNDLMNCFADMDNVQWVACSDLKPIVPSRSMEPGTRRANVQRAMDLVGVPRYYEDYHEMLDAEEFDIMIVCCENAFHREVVEATAAKGIHILVEKPMATSLPDALAMVRAAKDTGITLAINWPSTWMPVVRTAQKLVADGEIGEVWKFHYRNSSSLGPLAYGQKISDAEKGAEWWHQAAPGGGAFMDYCCYGSNLSRWFIGQPAVGAYGMKANFFSTYGDAEDNGIITARFPKAIADIEGSWTTLHPGVSNGPIVYGSLGTLVCDHAQGGSVLIYKDRRNQQPTAVYKAEALPEGRENIAREFIHHLETGEPLHPTLDLDVNIDAMAILDAGIRSAASGKFELAKDIHWNA